MIVLHHFCVVDIEILVKIEQREGKFPIQPTFLELCLVGCSNLQKFA
jgi:hypothetical protein